MRIDRLYLTAVGRQQLHEITVQVFDGTDLCTSIMADITGTRIDYIGIAGNSRFGIIQAAIRPVAHRLQVPMAIGTFAGGL